ncbi:hypothetical protein ACHAW6_007163 [Cyclotella cf. meneghiniana]
MSATDPPDEPSPAPPPSRYALLLSILQKSLTRTRDRISTEASASILSAYGDVSSFFATDADPTGIDTLANLLLSRVDTVHERFAESSVDGSSSRTPLEALLRDRGIEELLGRVENSIRGVDEEECSARVREEMDKQSAREAISMARTSQICNSPSSGEERKRRLLPGEYIGYHAYKLKLEHKESLVRQLEEIEKENDEMVGEMERLWDEWKRRVEELEGVVGVWGDMSAER